MSLLDFDRTGKIEVPVASDAEPARAWYFYRLRNDDFITEFCVAGAVGPQSVETFAPDGSLQKWDMRGEGDLIVFRAPDGYVGSGDGKPLLWAYDKRLQRGEAMPREEIERHALGGRITIAVPAA